MTLAVVLALTALVALMMYIWTQHQALVAQGLVDQARQQETAQQLLFQQVEAQQINDAYQKMKTPTEQELRQALPKSSDSFHANTDADPATVDPNQVGRDAMQQSEWGPNSPKMQQYYRTHPNMKPSWTTGTPGAPSPAATAPPAPSGPIPGVIEADPNLEEELKNVK